MSGKGMAQGMAAYLLVDTGIPGRVANGTLQRGFVQMMPPASGHYVGQCSTELLETHIAI